MSRLSLLSLLFLAGCYTPPVWSSVKVDGSFDAVWDKFVMTAQHSGFLPDEAGCDRGLKVYRSRWRTQAAGFRAGRRKRLHGEFELTGGSPAWELSFYVQNQNIPDMAAGFQPREEDWEDNGQDTSHEAWFRQQLRIAFGITEVDVAPSYTQGR